MKNLLKTFCFALVLGGSLQSFAAETTEKFKLIKVEDLIQLKNTEKDLRIYDANNEKVRKEKGVILGAVLLKNYKDYDASILPSDKKSPVVFYCANTKCTASHDAAQKALNLGYTNTMVLSDGIEGWVQARQPVSK